MAKTCRTCKSIYPLWRCACPDKFDAEPNAIMECHKPRETPLLVDRLAKMVRLLKSPVGDAHMEWAEAVCEADALLEEYQEEVGDDVEPEKHTCGECAFYNLVRGCTFAWPEGGQHEAHASDDACGWYKKPEDTELAEAKTNIAGLLDSIRWWKQQLVEAKAEIEELKSLADSRRGPAEHTGGVRCRSVA